ncbi:hypothetical protein PspLS_07098 [Pyricularia sp. CBS 133598]|nr:hypothetical protein PspLS_07098 [Pyricularia sp. CBS 133598]
MVISSPKAEEEVLQLWRDVDAFKTQLRLTQEGPRFTFYDGPPFEEAAMFNKTEGASFVADSSFFSAGNLNVIDRWILADCQSLLRFMEEEMRGYRLYTVVPQLLQVIDNLTNWYIWFNRKRLKGAAGLGVEDTRTALDTLFQVLFTIVRAMAPFTPFITEHIYGLLKPFVGDYVSAFSNMASVHFLHIPSVQEDLFDPVIERQVAAMQKVIQLACAARELRSISLKTPLLSLVVIADAQFIADVDPLKGYVADELNIREVILTDDEEKYNIHLEAQVDWPTLGRRLKKDASIVQLDDEGIARDIVDRVQRLRKKAGLVPTDDVRMQYNVVENPDGVDVEGLLRDRGAMFMGALRGYLEPTPTGTAGMRPS